MDKLDLVVRSVDEFDLVHGHEGEVDLFVMAVDGVEAVHRSDDERSTLLVMATRSTFRRVPRSANLVVVAVDEIDPVVAAVDEVDLVAKSSEEFYLTHGYEDEINLAVGSVVPSRGRPRPRPYGEVNLVHGHQEGQVDLLHGPNVEIDLVHGHDEEVDLVHGTHGPNDEVDLLQGHDEEASNSGASIIERMCARQVF